MKKKLFGNVGNLIARTGRSVADKKNQIILTITVTALAVLNACKPADKCTLQNEASDKAANDFSKAKHQIITVLLPQCYQDVPGFQNNFEGTLKINNNDTLISTEKTTDFYQTHQSFPTLSEATQSLVTNTNASAKSAIEMEKLKIKTWEDATKCNESQK